jgi:hypothetical protein
MARSAIRGAFWALVAIGIVISESLLADTAAGPHTESQLGLDKLFTGIGGQAVFWWLLWRREDRLEATLSTRPCVAGDDCALKAVKKGKKE